MATLSPSTKGAIAELEVTLAALRAGIPVYRPQAEGQRYDMVFDLGHRLARVQCKWGRLHGDVIVARTSTSRHTPNGYVKTTYSADEIDAFAIYCDALDECFYVPFEVVGKKAQLHLRVRPAKNNQRQLVTMADDHRLGAIAQLGERLHGMQEVAGSSPASSTPQEAA